MFKNKVKLLGFIPILAVLLLLGFSTPTKAAQFKTGDYTLSESEIVEENLYVSGDSVEIAGVVDGDLLVAADSVSITGTVTGDLYAGGNKIDISGNIYGSVFTAGQNIDITGSIARNLYVGAMFSDVSGSIGKDAMIFATNSSISGKVTEDVRVFSSRSTISGNIKGEALIYSPSSTINKELVKGDIYENREVENSVKIDTTPQVRNTFRNTFLGVHVFSTLIGFIGMYLVGIILIYLAPVKTLQIENKVVGSVQDFLFSFLVGLAIVVVLPLPFIILVVTIIGAPLAILIASVLTFLATFGTIWVESAIGHKMLSAANHEDPKRLLSLLIGRGLTTVVNFVPIVRGIYKFVLSMTAIGAIVRMKYDVYKEMKSSKKGKKK